MIIKTVDIVQVKAAKLAIEISKKLKEKPKPITIKIANAKRKPDPSLPEQETQYILED